MSIGRWEEVLDKPAAAKSNKHMFSDAPKFATSQQNFCRDACGRFCLQYGLKDFTDLTHGIGLGKQAK